jgi:GNAT superfamily N-acetyltransferase
MAHALKIKNDYKISFKRYFLKKKFLISVFDHSEDTPIDDTSEKIIIDEFLNYGIKTEKVDSIHYIYLKNPRFIQGFILCIYRISDVDGSAINVMKIMDIAILQKFRSRGIGRQLMAIADQMARENDIKFIVGDLQADRVGEPLDERMRFFRKNGFEVWEEKKGKFSGWVMKKAFHKES